MIDREGALALVRRVLALSRAEQTELILSSGSTELTRFAENAITQNVANRDESLSIHLISGKREGKADTNQFDDEHLARAVEAASRVMELAREDPQLPPLVEKQPALRAVGAFFPATAETSPAERAQVVAEACARCRKEGLQGSGIFSTSAGSLAYANSKGVFAFHKATRASFSLTANGADGASEGWALASDQDIGCLDWEKTVRIAIDKAKRSKNPDSLPPGRYTVVLEPAAVSELMLFMSYLGFSSLDYLEGRSYVCGKLGEKLFSEKFTVRDDAYHPEIRGCPFDFEGSAREPVTLIERGVAKNLVWDRRTAAREPQALSANGRSGRFPNGKRASTGHALPQPNPWGPQAEHIVVEGGDSTLDEMIRSTDRGLLVTKFHYTNVVNRVELSVTGMTRSGLFLIERGEVARPVKNFRFTVSLLEVFGEENLESLGPAVPTGGALFDGGVMICPPMKIRNFQMTSATEF